MTHVIGPDGPDDDLSAFATAAERANHQAQAMQRQERDQRRAERINRGAHSEGRRKK